MLTESHRIFSHRNRTLACSGWMDTTVAYIGSRAFLFAAAVLEQAARQCHVRQFVVGFPAATETHTVPAVIPRHYHVTFLNCNTHSGLAVALLLRPL